MNETRLFMVSNSGHFMTAPASLQGFNKLDARRKADPRFHGKNIIDGAFPSDTPQLEGLPVSGVSDPVALKCVEKVPYGDRIIQFIGEEYTVEAREEHGHVRGFITDAVSAETTEYSLISHDGKDTLVIAQGTGYSLDTTGDEVALDLVERMIRKLKKMVRRRVRA